MMRFYKLPKERWEDFFDDLAASLTGHRPFDIDVAGPKIGNQVLAHHLSLNGITYDRNSDTLYLYSNGEANGLDHAISQPREIWVDFAASGLSRIVIKEDGDQQQFVTIREPIGLPANIEAGLRSGLA
jgi:hypothetical protein